ncbi:hypothetical protein [Dermacoccus nishinomiyaensis]|uniref:hypothetical protein n=1 Tax=Dermacoccus nishinomiyaensis TaxID=1274 RepID=UPI00164337DE|nr:hypothetical protein [Dermacoccus nishinomiyaensis]
MVKVIGEGKEEEVVGAGMMGGEVREMVGVVRGERVGRWWVEVERGGGGRRGEGGWGGGWWRGGRGGGCGKGGRT